MFISFEGIDFCGKSTQIKLLKEYLERKNIVVEILREPGGTEISEQVRTILLSKKNNLMTLETEVLLFAASRAQLVREKLIPLLQSGSYVISDRFHDSTTAYQGYGRGIPLNIIDNIHKISVGDTLPDLTFLIDISLEEVENRKLKISNSELDRIEISDRLFFEKVRTGYLELAKSEKRFVIINGLEEVNHIHDKIVTIINQHTLGNVK
ncbi:MAG TPA: dTMP kinase [Ignavibacteriaceae bacterium]|nr:dTMP kinase [Ignavibacteriaceae bacterium]